MATSYGTVAQLAARTNLLGALTIAQELTMEEILEAASRTIDRFCKRDEEFGSSSVSSIKYFTADGKSYLRIPTFLEIDEIAVKASITATEFTVWTKESSYLAGDGDWYAAHGDPTNPSFEPPGDLIMVSPMGSYSVFPDGEGAPVIKVTAVWGFSDQVPADIREACLMQAARWIKQFQGSMSTELGSVDLGAIQYRRRLSSDVCQILIDGCWVLPLYGGA
jgi:hypothetical protein